MNSLRLGRSLIAASPNVSDTGEERRLFDWAVTHGAAARASIRGVNELHNVLIAPSGLFAAGKFDRYKARRPVRRPCPGLPGPYSMVSQPKRGEVRPVAGRARTEALSPNSQLILNPVPEVELKIGLQLRVTDDMYSLDAATRELLEHLITRPGVHHLTLRPNQATQIAA